MLLWVPTCLRRPEPCDAEYPRLLTTPHQGRLVRPLLPPRSRAESGPVRRVTQRLMPEPRALSVERALRRPS